MKKKFLPKIIAKKAKNEIKESGCCFRSCGGVPLHQDYQPKIIKIPQTKVLIKRIK